jgi:voltage-gated potassium channel
MMLPPLAKRTEMKAIRHIVAHLHSTKGRQNLVIFRNFFYVLAAIVLINSLLFHAIMEREQVVIPEGKNQTLDNDLLIAIYWVLITMSTVGYGDITFETHLGQFFSLAVMMSGVVYLFILLPFSFMEFFYKPLVKLQSESRVPREAPEGLENHVILTCYDSIARKLTRRLIEFDYGYIFLLNDLETAIDLVDHGIPVIYGPLDDQKSYIDAGIKKAAMLVATSSDVTNCNVAFTARSVRRDDAFKILSLCTHQASEDVLELAGSSKVLRLPAKMAEFFATRIIGGERSAHIIGQINDLCIAEARVRNTTLIGKTIRNSNLRDKLSLIVLGTMEQGRYHFKDLDKEITENITLLLAGTREKFEAYNQYYNPKGTNSAPQHVIIIGGGDVGRFTARALADHGIPYQLLDNDVEHVHTIPNAVLGDGAERSDLEKVGLDVATSVIITTADDELNFFLTMYCRKLRPDVHIFTRASRERNLDRLKNAGANFVISYDATGANFILNHLCPDNLITITEGLDLFRCPVPDKLVGKTVLASRLLPDLQCIVVAIVKGEKMLVNPGATDILQPQSEMILMGSTESERLFKETYSAETKPTPFTWALSKRT